MPVFEQTVGGFLVGADYSLSLMTMFRQGRDGGNDLEVILDLGLETEQYLIDIDEVTFTSFTEIESSSFFAEKDSYTLTIRSTNPFSGQDRTTAFDNVWFNQLTNPVPEPGTFVLAGMMGLALLTFHIRRRK